MQGVQSAIDNLWRSLDQVRSSLSNTLHVAITQVIPAQAELVGAAIAQSGKLGTEILETLSTLDEYTNATQAGFWGWLIGPNPVWDAAATPPRLVFKGARASAESQRGQSPTRHLADVGLPDIVPPLKEAVLDVASFMAIATAGANPAIQVALRDANLYSPQVPLAAADVIAGKARGHITGDPDYDKRMAMLGFSPDDARIMRENAAQFLTPAEIFDGSQRGFIDSQQAEDMLIQQHWDKPERDAMALLFKAYPSPQDLVMMAGREVFEADQIAEFKLDEGFDALDIPKKWAGNMDADVLRAYWIAHWETPSPQQIFEMLHRGKLDPEQLGPALRLLDISPFFADKLAAIAYNPLTRVDVRRMHNLGEMTQAEVVRAYMDLGYDVLNAERLGRFSQKLVDDRVIARRERAAGPYRAELLESYKALMLDSQQVTQLLTAVGFTESQITVYLTAADADIAFAGMAEHANGIERQFIRGLVGADAARDALIAAGYPSDTAGVLVGRWSTAREYRVMDVADRAERDLTRADILTSYRELLADATATAASLEGIGYSANESAQLVALEDAKQGRAERARVERSVKNSYMRGALAGDAVLGALQVAGVLPARAAMLVAQWTDELAADAPRLTVAQIERAVIAGRLSIADGLAALAVRGYTISDAELLAAEWQADMISNMARVALEERRLAQARAIETERQGLQRELATARQASALVLASKALESQLVLLERKAEAETAKRLASVTAADLRLDKLGAQASALVAQRGALATKAAAAAGQRDISRFAAADRILAAKLAGAIAAADRLTTAKADAVRLAEVSRSAAVEHADTLRRASAVRSEANAVARDARSSERSMRAIALRAQTDIIKADGTAEALARVEAAVREVLARMMAQAVGQRG